MTTPLRTLSFAALALLCLLKGGPPSAARSGVSGTVLKAVADVQTVAKLTGPGSTSQTDVNWALFGTDLGHTFSMKNRLYMVFGDSFGVGFTPPPDDSSWIWDLRGNAMAVIEDRTPADGLNFTRMITDRPGHAGELLPSQRDPNGVGETALIPTNGIASGSRMYLHLMSVRSWDSPGRWTLNSSSLAYSDDEGAHWARPQQPQWAGSSGFGQVAFTRAGKTLYLFGIPGGRFGDVRLARVKERQLLDPTAYQYFSGLTGRKARWAATEAESVPVAAGPAGELSVMWSPFLRRWLMTYLDEPARALVIREAVQPWGPWSSPKLLVSADDYPGLYCAYMHPALTERRGEILYFTMSRWPEYNVFLMRARLVK